jgi:hypothetical protein
MSDSADMASVVRSAAGSGLDQVREFELMHCIFGNRNDFGPGLGLHGFASYAGEDLA